MFCPFLSFFLIYLALCSTPVINSRSNETLLFSIIKPVDIDLVAKKGFVKADELFCRKQFGRGIYFTDNAINGAASVWSLYFLLTIRQHTTNRTIVARLARNLRWSSPRSHLATLLFS